MRVPARTGHRVVSVGPLVVLVERRTLVVSVVLAVLCLGLGAVALTLGSYGLSAGEALAALAGRSSDPLATFFVQSQRAPRALGALLVGGALGLSGALLQSLSRNPLGSPDIVGFTVGAATGALVAILVVGTTPLGTSIGAVAGGLLTAVAVVAIAGSATLSSQRIILVGIGLALILQAVNSLLLVRAELGAAQTAAQWLAGSLNGITWSRVSLVAIGVAGLGIATMLLSRSLQALSLGDDLAATLGVDVGLRRGLLIVISVALVSLATAATGPIAFIALAAPQLAWRLARTPSGALLPATLMGALLVLVSDIAAQRLFAPTQLAVGVVSGAVGGVYLVWLLAVEWRQR
jgi:iron complex transport system permease protein